jgi:hypothetical protein
MRATRPDRAFGKIERSVDCAGVGLLAHQE